MRILFFGDSITQGFYDEEGGWASRLSNHYHLQSLQNMSTNGKMITCFNLGISGETTSGLLSRIEAEFDMRNRSSDRNIIVIAVGINDASLVNNQPVSSPESYVAHMEQLIEKARSKSDQVLVVGLTIVDDVLCNPWRFSSTGRVYNNKLIWEFELSLRALCDKMQIRCVRVFEVMQEWQKAKNVHADGLHPNSIGHKVIAERVKIEIDNLLAQMS